MGGTPGRKEVTFGEYSRDSILTHNYFETLLPRFPEPLKREWISKLKKMDLPTRSVGNGGQGGVDRRGMDEPNRRPASVKASLSVGFKQRAPNRKNSCELSEIRTRETNLHSKNRNNSFDNENNRKKQLPSMDRSRNQNYNY